MTIQVGHPHECPTFFCAPKGKSTSQQVNKFASCESTGWCPMGRISPICPMLTNVKVMIYKVSL